MPTPHFIESWRSTSLVGRQIAANHLLSGGNDMLQSAFVLGSSTVMEEVRIDSLMEKNCTITDVGRLYFLCCVFLMRRLMFGRGVWFPLSSPLFSQHLSSRLLSLHKVTSQSRSYRRTHLHMRWAQQGGVICKLREFTDWCLEVQLLVYKKKIRKVKTEPWGEPVLMQWKTGSQWSTCRWEQTHSAGRAFPAAE